MVSGSHKLQLEICCGRVCAPSVQQSAAAASSSNKRGACGAASDVAEAAQVASGALAWAAASVAAVWPSPGSGFRVYARWVLEGSRSETRADFLQAW